MVKPKSVLKVISNTQVARPSSGSNPPENERGASQSVDRFKKDLVQRGDILKRMDALLAELKQKEASRQNYVEAQNLVSKSLTERIVNVESQNAALSKQMETFKLHAIPLAMEARALRQSAVTMMYGSAGFAPPRNKRSRFKITDPVVAAGFANIPRTGAAAYLCCLPYRFSMPIYIPDWGRSGYWFQQPYVQIQSGELDLLVELAPNDWTYFGGYISTYMPNQQMKVSEWLTLDEEKKRSYVYLFCQRGLPPGVPVSAPMLQLTRQRFDSGEFSVSCFALKSLGYNMALYDILEAAAAGQQVSPASPSRASSVETDVSAGTQSLVEQAGTSSSASPDREVDQNLKRSPEAEDATSDAGPVKVTKTGWDEGNAPKRKKRRHA